VEEVAVRDEGDPLAPRPVPRGEVGLEVVVLAQDGLDPFEQLGLEGLRLLERHPRDVGLVVEDLAADDLVDPGLVDLELPQRVGQLVGVAAGHEVGGGPLEHRDVLHLGGHGRDERCRRGHRADDDHPLVRVIEVLGPGLGVDDRPLEAVHALPFRGVALGVPVVALAHPQEVAGEAALLAGVGYLWVSQVPPKLSWVSSTTKVLPGHCRVRW